MQMYKIITNGICIHGYAFVIAKEKDEAVSIFKKEHDCKPEDEIININVIELDYNNPRVIYYDDGDR